MIALLLAAAAHAHTVHPLGPSLNAALSPNLAGAFSEMRRGAQKAAADRFSDPPHSRLVDGEPVSFSIRPIDGRSTGRAYFVPASWDYSGGRLSYSFMVLEVKGAHPAIVRARQTPRGSYVASNAFGATRTVDADSVETDEIDVRSAPPTADFYKLDIAVSGAEARRLVADIELVVSGTAASGGVCETDVHGPSLDFQQEVRTAACTVPINVRQVSYVRKSTGEVLKTWGSAAP